MQGETYSDLSLKRMERMSGISSWHVRSRCGGKSTSPCFILDDGRVIGAPLRGASGGLVVLFFLMHFLVMCGMSVWDGLANDTVRAVLVMASVVLGLDLAWLFYGGGLD